MKVQSFEYMQTQYGGNRDLEPEDLEERTQLLNKYKYSVIVEGSYLELDILHNWIKQELPDESVLTIFYGKTDYDYGFEEFFFKDKTHVEKFRNTAFSYQNP